jgi:hypothetical protein
LKIFSTGMEEEMDVRVDEAGEERRVAEVDDARVCRVVNGCADGANAVALDKNFAGLEESAGVNLEEACGMKHDGLLS